MNKHQLEGMKVAILVTDGFEQSEMTDPRKALEAAGAETKIVSPKNDRVRGSRHGDPADTFTVDIPLAQAAAHEFDALLLPDRQRLDDRVRVDRQPELLRQRANAGGSPRHLALLPFVADDKKHGKEPDRWASAFAYASLQILERFSLQLGALVLVEHRDDVGVGQPRPFSSTSLVAARRWMKSSPRRLKTRT